MATRAHTLHQRSQRIQVRPVQRPLVYGALPPLVTLHVARLVRGSGMYFDPLNHLLSLLCSLS